MRTISCSSSTAWVNWMGMWSNLACASFWPPRSQALWTPKSLIMCSVLERERWPSERSQSTCRLTLSLTCRHCSGEFMLNESNGNEMDKIICKLYNSIIPFLVPNVRNFQRPYIKDNFPLMIIYR